MYIDGIKVWTNKILIQQSDKKELVAWTEAYADATSAIVRFTKERAEDLL